MVEEIAFKNRRISNFEGLVTTLTLNRLDFICTDRQTFETSFIRSTLSKSQPKRNDDIPSILRDTIIEHFSPAVTMDLKHDF